MFGKFGGIVIIALSIAIIAGLILRSVPEHPPALSLGVPETEATTETKPAAPVETKVEDISEKEMTDTATETTEKVVEEAKEVVTEKLDETKDAIIEKTEALTSTTVEAIQETVTDTVESADEVVGVVKETVDQQLETKSE